MGAIVTGGARGIGLATARALAARGHRVALVDLAGAAAAAAAIGGGAFGVDGDVSSPSVREVVVRTVEELGGLDVLVNNAGNMRIADAEGFPDEAWESVVSTHLGGAFRCSKAAFPALRESHGAIVNTASISAHRGMPGLLAYAAAKAGIESLTRTLAIEWAPHGIRVNAVAPGHTLTPMVEDAIADGQMPEEELERWCRRIPLEHRLARPDEIASAIAFLASPEASYITGQVLVADGGLTINGTYD